MISWGRNRSDSVFNQYFIIRNKGIGTKHVFAGSSRLASKLMKQDRPGSNPNGKTPLEKDLYFFHPDHLGSSNYITDSQGQMFEHLEYFPFGETWVEESSNTQRTPYLFTGKELDEETGLYYFGARYYDPRTSVWQSTDPILEKYLPGAGRSDPSKLAGMGGVFNPFNVAMYSYSFQNPVKYLDPDGNAPNQAGATDPKVILKELKAYEAAGMSHSQALSTVSAAHGGNQNRYFHTDEFGWVDVRHFGKAAEMANDTGSNVLVEALGIGNEMHQWWNEGSNDYQSGFSPEDIPSNAAGARFGESLDPKKSLSSQFEGWLNDVGARNKTDSKANLQSLPLTDPSVRGGANRGSSNASSAGPGANREPPPPMEIIAP